MRSKFKERPETFLIENFFGGLRPQTPVCGDFAPKPRVRAGASPLFILSSANLSRVPVCNCQPYYIWAESNTYRPHTGLQTAFSVWFCVINQTKTIFVDHVTSYFMSIYLYCVDVARCKELAGSCTKNIRKSLTIHEVVQTTDSVAQRKLRLSNNEATVVCRFFLSVSPGQCQSMS